jgi:phenylacetate-CoA ligase
VIEQADFAHPRALGGAQRDAWQGQRERVARASPFLRALWKGADPPRRLEDLPELPLCDKAVLRADQAAHPPFGSYLAAPSERVMRVHRTSGTTGQAMNLALSARDAAVTAEVGGRSHRAAGLGPGHRVIHCLNYRMWMGGVTDHLTLEAAGATVTPFGVGETELLVRTVRELAIDAISCTPSYPAVLERVIAERFPGLAPIDLGLRLGLFGGEPGLDDPELRRRLRETWGMEPRNANYGVSDVLSNFAAQCEQVSDLHFLAGDVLYPELVDAESGAPVDVRAGASGELVLTHLERECQPLVRFRTGDVVTVTDTGSCACARTGFRFRVVGRTDDMVVVRGINVFPTMVAAVLSPMAALSGEYRIRLRGLGPYDRLPIEVELAGEIPDRSGLAREVEDAIKRSLGVRAEISLLASRSLPRTEGKTRRVLRED